MAREEEVIAMDAAGRAMDDLEAPMQAAGGADLLLAAARRLFLEQGYANVSMQAIAREAGMTKGAPYYYFPSKEALFLAVSREVLRSLRDAVRVAFCADGTLEARLGNALRVVVSTTSDDLSTWLTDLKLVLKPGDQLALVEGLIGSHELSDLFLPVFQEAQDAGDLTRVSPEVAARVFMRIVMSCVDECSHWRLIGAPSGWNADQAIAESVDVFLHGVGAVDQAESAS
ncbi:MAG: helix-turn-helix domain-containing protein [Thermomicrobiales bacterium]